MRTIGTLPAAAGDALVLGCGAVMVAIDFVEYAAADTSADATHGQGRILDYQRSVPGCDASAPRKSNATDAMRRDARAARMANATDAMRRDACAPGKGNASNAMRRDARVPRKSNATDAMLRDACAPGKGNACVSWVFV